MAQDDFLQFQERVKQAESRGRRYDKNGNLLTSPKGAQGEMQVMPATQRSPGFGITPAKDRSPEEIARVGTDYLATMKKRYGDETLAAIAYNMGPGATDKWLAAGADFSKLPAETQGYVQKVMGKTPTAPATASKPSNAPEIVEPALRSGMTASAEDLGSGYKAALALSFLGAEDADKPETDEDLQARLDREEEDAAAAEFAAYKPKNALADLKLSATSHLQQPVKLAAGGLPFTPSAGIKGTSREELDAIKAQYDKYNADADAYNAALNKYKTDLYDPYIAAIAKYNTAAEEWNKGPRTTAFGMAEPTAPKEFTLTAPTAPTVSQADYEAKQAAAKQDMLHRQAAIDAASDPERYGLTINKFFADGGEADKEEKPMMADIPEQSNVNFIRAANRQHVGDKQIENMMLGLGIDKATIGLNLSNLRQNDKDNLARSLMAAYNTKIGDVGVDAALMRPMDAPPGVYMGNVGASYPVGEGRVMAGVNAMRTPEGGTQTTGSMLGYSGKVGPGYLNATMMQPRGNPQGRQYQMQYAVPFADGGDVMGSNMPLNPNPMAGTPEMMFWHGGVVHRADGSPMGGENVDHLTPQEIERMAEAQRPAFVTPSSGRGRQQGPISQALNSGTAYPAMARGVAELPYDIAGAPVDLATMAMRPFGYKEEKPVLGSDWIKEKMTALGIRPGEETDPTLKGFRTFGELGANLVNPAAVARKVGSAVEQGAKAVGRAAGEVMNERMLAGQSIVPGMNVAPPIAFAVPPGPSMAAAAVTPENQFVGRLDNFVATMKNPVRKDQLIAQISKNFREYDVGRMETALADVASDAKLTPAQISERLSTTYNPNRFRTTVIEPSEKTRGSFYQGMDNPYYDQLSGNGPPLGVIHMSLQSTPEQQATQQAAKDTSEAFRRLLRASATPDEIQTVRGFLQTPEFNALPNARDLQSKFDTGIKQSETINNYMKEVSELDNKLRYPILSVDYQPIFDTKMSQYRANMPWQQAYDRAQMETRHELIDKANQWLTKNGYKGLNSDTMSLIRGKNEPADVEDYITAVKEALDPVEVMVMKAHDNLKNYLKAPVYEVNQVLSKDLPYTGQHTSLKNESNPIAFSRFSAHTAQIPGIGEAKGIYVNELQSDLLDDLRKMGKKGGSKEKDLELVQKTEKEIDNLRQQMNEALAMGKGAKAEDLSKQIDGAKKRLRTVQSRSRIGTYDVPEAIHNMENLPQVTQQLMAKNVIGAAIQRGDQFVAFPGKESAQAQLYEKLPYNLKQVVKDLGPGFEIRPVELDSPQGKMMHTAVVWGPEAAARVKKTGVPFKDGGAVERVTTDNRRYL